MEHVSENGRASLIAILAGLGTAGFFEAAAVLATQDKTVRAVSPWQEDPYDAVVSLSQFAVPMLALVIALRLPAWRAPGGPDRAQQTIRAAGAMMTLIVTTLVFEWAAVIVGPHASSRGAWTSVLISGLVAASVLTMVVSTMLVRCRRPRGRPAGGSTTGSATWSCSASGFRCCGAGPQLRPRLGCAGMR